MTEDKNISISRKLIAYFLFSAIFLTIFGTAVSFFQDRIFFKNHIKKSIDRIETIVIPEIKKGLKKNNTSDIQSILNTIFSSQSYSYLSLDINKEGQTDQKNIFKKGSKNTTTYNNSLKFHYTDEKNKKINGTLIISPNKKVFEQEIKRRALKSLSLQLVQFIFFTILIIFILKALILNHIKDMIKYTKEVDLKDESNDSLALKKSKGLYRDELDQLTDAINKVKSKLYESQENLKDYTNNLETKVQIRTEDLSESLKNMESLLNNLKQAIFSVNEEGVIESPSSNFSKEIFEQNIEGLSIFETIFSGLSENSETYSAIQFANACNFGNDEFQWNMILEQYPTRVVLSKKNINEEKILKINYIPLWNRVGLLKKIMYVVEDVTEVEKLEFEMKAQKESTNRKVKILQELGSNKRPDLNSFFLDTLKLSVESQSLAKEIQEQIGKEENMTKGFRIIFRHLHTIKGNARIYNLSYISSFVHGLENQVSRFTTIESKDISKELLQAFTFGLYDLHGIINYYLNAGREVFGIEFMEDREFKDFLHKSIITLENLMCRVFDRDRNTIELANGSTDNDSIFEEIYSLNDNLIRLTRCLDHPNLSKNISSFKKYLKMVQNGLLLPSDIEFNLIHPFSEINKGILDITLSSSHFKPLALNSNDWLDLFLKLLRITETFIRINEDRKSFLKSFYELKGLLDKINIVFFDFLMDIIQNVLNSKSEEYFEKIKYNLKLIWHFLGLTSQIDMSKKQKDNLNQPEIYFMFCEACENDGKNKKYLESILNSIFDNEITSLDAFFVPTYQVGNIVMDSYPDLKRNNMLEIIELFNRVKKDFPNSPFIKSLEFIFNPNKLPWGRYVINLSTIQLLAYYAESDVSVDQMTKPDMVEVLAVNFEKFKEKISELSKLNKKDSTLEETFNMLYDLPVKYSLRKFSPFIDEVSERINKKVDFKLKGDECSLDQERLSLLSDAIMHLIRNSLDHGIEDPEERMTLGKNEAGLIEIQCLNEEDEIIEIRVSDDGKGINENKIFQSALQKKLVEKDQAKKMTIEDKINLIFLPNFSTKNMANDMSGRGVGMDVVKRNIDKMGGTLKVETEEEFGTTFFIRIPIKEKPDKKVS